MPGPPSSPTHTLRDVPAAAGGTGEAVLRRRMVRLAYAPALAVALAAAGAMAYLWFARDPDDATTVDTGFGDAATPGVLGAALLIAVAALAFGVRSASAQARTTLDQYAALRRGAEHSRFQIQDLLRKLEAGEPPSSPASGHPPPALPGSVGVLGSLAQELALAQRSAEAAVAQAAALPRRNRAESAESAGAGEGGQRLQAADRVTVFVNLSRRLQSLLHREIKVLDELENQVEDPEILKSVFQVDHLATRIRRYAENLAVLGGAVSRRQWTKPVRLSEIMRSSAAEVEHYLRIKLVPPIEGTVRGQAVADVIHLLAELVENATVYSAPQTQVLLRASHVTAGLAIEVEDRGLGMTGDEQRRMNALLADPEDVDVAALLTDGRIGLYVVGTLARRHGIAVELRSNIYGGIQAVLVLPHSMLGDREGGRQQDGAAPAAPPADPGAASHAAPGVVAPGSTMAPQGTAAPVEPAPAEGFPDRTVPRRASAPEPTLRLQRGRHAAPSPPAPAPPPEPAPRPHPTPPPGTSPDGTSAPRRTPVSGAAGPISASPAGPAAGQPREPAGGRPPLPLRRKQQHIVPELRDTAATPSGATGGRGEAEPVHNPGLMAAFQRGVGRADAEDRDRPSSSPPPPPSPYDGDSRFP
ncbi:ATP-binding protein [Streptomyces sp. NPDC006784]|uniref:sensor histidine kinase n=1 Tax=Streptomyces sp. NPDC006784 TaxID=3364764 RepID=UPI0036987205